MARRLLLQLSLCCLFAGTVWAQSPADGAEPNDADSAEGDAELGEATGGNPDSPWAAGVAPENQRQALELYSRGNKLFEQSKHLEALEQYRKAIEFWDHPAIRYNMAVCLINIDKYLEAFGNLEKAMAHGEEPLGKRHFGEGKAEAWIFRRGELGTSLLRYCVAPCVMEILRDFVWGIKHGSIDAVTHSVPLRTVQKFARWRGLRAGRRDHGFA